MGPFAVFIRANIEFNLFKLGLDRPHGLTLGSKFLSLFLIMHFSLLFPPLFSPLIYYLSLQVCPLHYLFPFFTSFFIVFVFSLIPTFTLFSPSHLPLHYLLTSLNPASLFYSLLVQLSFLLFLFALSHFTPSGFSEFSDETSETFLQTLATSLTWIFLLGWYGNLFCYRYLLTYWSAFHMRLARNLCKPVSMLHALGTLAVSDMSLSFSLNTQSIYSL